MGVMLPPAQDCGEGCCHPDVIGVSPPDLGSTGLCKSLAETSNKSLHLSEAATSFVKWGESYLLHTTISRMKLSHN